MTDFAIPAVIFLCMVVLYILRYREKSRQGVKLINPKYQVGAATTLGTRITQQDYFGVKELSGALLVLLADGSGEHGDIAAKISVDTFRELFTNKAAVDKPQYFFRRAANATNRKILNVLEERQGYSSVAAVVINDSKLVYSLVGNCRVAVFRKGDLVPVSEGQTIDVLARHRYEEGRISKLKTLALLDRHRLYNVLGQDAFQEIELFSKPLTITKSDLIVIFSEGVFNVLRWKELEDILDKRQSPQILADEIIQRVNKSSFVDKPNATVLICRLL